MPFRPALALTLLLALTLAAPPPAMAQFVPEDADLFVGRPVRIVGAAPGDTLVVTYRPSSSIPQTETLVGARVWTPSQAGVVRLAGPGEVTQNVSVRFQGTPVQGLFVLFGAGLILFGGAGYAFRKLFEDDDLPVA